jgi:hypothetical protein
MKHAGDLPLPPAKRQHLDDAPPVEQWGQADALVQLEAQFRATPKPPRSARDTSRVFLSNSCKPSQTVLQRTIVGWLPDEKSFVVVDPKTFVTSFSPKPNFSSEKKRTTTRYKLKIAEAGDLKLMLHQACEDGVIRPNE